MIENSPDIFKFLPILSCIEEFYTNLKSVKSLPKGSKGVINVFTEYESLTFEEINQMTSISEKSLRYVLRRLLETDILISVPNLLDMRVKSYKLNFDLIHGDSLEKHHPGVAKLIADIKI